MKNTEKKFEKRTDICIECKHHVRGGFFETLLYGKRLALRCDLFPDPISGELGLCRAWKMECESENLFEAK